MVDYRAEAVSALVEKLNNGEDWVTPQRWDPVVPHGSVIAIFPGYVIRYGGGMRGDKWYAERLNH
jgi:hypothetical protein